MRAGAWHAQELRKTVLDTRRERVLEPVSLLVGVRPVEAERVREPALEETMTTGHELGDLPALGGEHQLLAASDLHVPAAGHAMDRLGHRGSRDAHVLGEPGADHWLATARQVIDRREVVLDRSRRGSRLGRDFQG